MVAYRVPDGIDLAAVMKIGVIDGEGGVGVGALPRGRRGQKGAKGEESKVEPRGMRRGRLTSIIHYSFLGTMKWLVWILMI